MRNVEKAVKKVKNLSSSTGTKKAYGWAIPSPPPHQQSPPTICLLGDSNLNLHLLPLMGRGNNPKFRLPHLTKFQQVPKKTPNFNENNHHELVPSQMHICLHIYIYPFGLKLLQCRVKIPVTHFFGAHL